MNSYTYFNLLCNVGVFCILAHYKCPNITIIIIINIIFIITINYYFVLQAVVSFVSPKSFRSELAPCFRDLCCDSDFRVRKTTASCFYEV